MSAASVTVWQVCSADDYTRLWRYLDEQGALEAADYVHNLLLGRATLFADRDDAVRHVAFLADRWYQEDYLAALRERVKLADAGELFEDPDDDEDAKPLDEDAHVMSVGDRARAELAGAPAATPPLVWRDLGVEFVPPIASFTLMEAYLDDTERTYEWKAKIYRHDLPLTPTLPKET